MKRLYFITEIRELYGRETLDAAETARPASTPLNSSLKCLTFLQI